MNEEDLEARRRRLRETIDAHEASELAEQERSRASQSGFAGYAAAFRLSTEFVSAIVVGLVFGYGLDWLLGTLPLFLMIFLLLGFAAGVLNVLRSAGLIQAPQVGKRPPNGGETPPHP